MKEMMEKFSQRDSHILDLMKDNKTLLCKLMKTSDKPESQERENHLVEELMAELAKIEDTWKKRVKDMEGEREDLLRELQVLEEVNEKVQAVNQELKEEERRQRQKFRQ